MLHKVGIFFHKPLIFIFKFAFYIYYTVRYCNAYSTVCFRCFNITLTNHCVKKIKCNKCDANVLNALANLCTGVNNYFCRQTRKRDAVKWIKNMNVLYYLFSLKWYFYSIILKRVKKKYLLSYLTDRLLAAFYDILWMTRCIIYFNTRCPWMFCMIQMLKSPEK